MSEFPFEYKIKRYRSSRSIKLRVIDDGTVIVTAHILTPNLHIIKFINEHIDWIITQKAKIYSHQNHLTTAREELLLRGKSYEFLLAIDGQQKVELTGRKIIVHSPKEEHSTVRNILERWYKKQAKKYFSVRVILLADLVDSDIKTVTIRSQRSRWGSCSSRQTISLNWRLILCPDWVSDYVIYHELAHLKEMNHSVRFWELVGAYYPNYKKAEKWLKDNHSLLRF